MIERIKDEKEIVDTKIHKRQGEVEKKMVRKTKTNNREKKIGEREEGRTQGRDNREKEIEDAQVWTWYHFMVGRSWKWNHLGDWCSRFLKYMSKWAILCAR